MNRNYFLHFFLILSTSLLLSCNKEDDGVPVDNTPPTITNVTLNNLSPEDQIVVSPGSEMDFDATFTDDTALGQYRIDIHNDFDGHDHGRLKTERFSFNQTYTLTGTSQSVHEHIGIPENAAPGPYHLTVHFLDAAGNEGEDVIFDFIIADPESQPIINITSHNFDEEIETVAGESIVLEGTVTDADGLDEVHIILMKEGDEHSHGRKLESEPYLYDKEYELDGATIFNFNNADPILIPEGTPAGHYELVITAKDILGNISSKSTEVHVD